MIRKTIREISWKTISWNIWKYRLKVFVFSLFINHLSRLTKEKFSRSKRIFTFYSTILITNAIRKIWLFLIMHISGNLLFSLSLRSKICNTNKWDKKRRKKKHFLTIGKWFLRLSVLPLLFNRWLVISNFYSRVYKIVIEL